MRKLFIGIVIFIMIITIFLIYNHKQPPTKDHVYKITENLTFKTEEVYLVKKIIGKWFTVFRHTHSTLLAQLKQNWLGFWEFNDDKGLVATNYSPLHDKEFTLGSSGNIEGEPSYYFGQIINPNIKEIKVEIQENNFIDTLIINAGEFRFYFLQTEERVNPSVNISGFSESGKLIYSASIMIME